MDLGCGTGQNSRPLTAYFEQVVGIDVSESQVEQARAVPGFPNLSYRSVMHGFKSNQIKSNHFYCHITTAQVPW